MSDLHFNKANPLNIAPVFRYSDGAVIEGVCCTRQVPNDDALVVMDILKNSNYAFKVYKRPANLVDDNGINKLLVDKPNANSEPLLLKVVSMKPASFQFVSFLSEIRTANLTSILNEIDYWYTIKNVRVDSINLFGLMSNEGLEHIGEFPLLGHSVESPTTSTEQSISPSTFFR